jgi:hypothetical protein
MRKVKGVMHGNYSLKDTKLFAKKDIKEKLHQMLHDMTCYGAQKLKIKLRIIR